MKRSSTIFLQIVVVLIGAIMLTLMLWEPHLEGRNAHATTLQIYFNDPFLAYAYTASLAFFTALYQAFKLLGFAGRNNIFSPDAVKSIRIIKYCALLLIAFVLGAEGYIWVFVRGTDDIAGGVAMGLMMMFVSVVVATAAGVFEHFLQNAVNMKSENDLTV